MPASAILRNIPLAVRRTRTSLLYFDRLDDDRRREIWRFNVAGSKEVRDYRVKGNTFATTRNLRWSWHEITWGLFCARQKCAERPARRHAGALLQQPYEWWLDLVAIFRKREYHPGGSSMCWMKCCVKFATSLPVAATAA